MIGVRLPIEIEKRLDALAKATGRTKTYYVREAILEHLDDMEDAYLAEATLERIRLGDERVLSSEEFWRGLED
jgi:RHH-type rel operon transcriptional repressor/antitoxin RelB